MVIHLLKLIRSRLGGSCWILVELLVVFVILWFMMYYFVAQGMLTRMPVGFKLDHVYNVTLAIRPSDSPSFIAYEEGSEEPVRNIERIVERIERHPRRGGGRALVLFVCLIPTRTSAAES